MTTVYRPQVQFKGKEVCETGPCRAVIVGIFHIGTQTDTYEGKTTTRDTVYLEFELSEQKSDGSRFKVGKEIGTNLGQANPKKGRKTWLREIAESCFPKISDGFAVWDLIGKSCMVTIGHTSGGNAKIVASTKLMKDQSPLPPAGKLISWSILDPQCSGMNDDVPDFIMEKAKNCHELAEMQVQKEFAKANHVTGHAVDPDDDSAPF